GRREFRAVDDIAAVARQFHAAALFRGRGSRFGELARETSDLNHGRSGREGEHHGHLQKDAEEVANVVGAVILETLGTVSTLEQKSLSGRDPRERPLEVSRLAGKHQRRKSRKLLFNLRQGLLVRIIRHLGDRQFAPMVRRPTLKHHNLRDYRGSTRSPKAQPVPATLRALGPAGVYTSRQAPPHGRFGPHPLTTTRVKDAPYRTT